jgi:hypothetical protein
MAGTVTAAQTVRAQVQPSRPPWRRRRGSLLWMTKREESMAHAIIRAANGRRHDVAFEGASITVGIFLGEDTVEIAVEAPQDLAPSDKRRFAQLNVPPELFNKAPGEAPRRSMSERPAFWAEGR